MSVIGVHINTFSVKAVLFLLVLLINDQLLIVAILILVDFIILLRKVLSASCTIRLLLNFLLTMSDQEVSLYSWHLIPIILLVYICCRHWTKNSLTIWLSKSTDQADWIELVLHINLVFEWRTESILFGLFAS